MPRPFFAVACVLAFALMALGPALPVSAAAPRLMLAYGPLLPQPIMLDNWQENGYILGAIEGPLAQINEVSLAGRPVIHLALFWNAFLWEPYVQQRRLNDLRPEDANQQADFYPSVGAAEPFYVGMMDGRVGVHRISPRGTEVLAHHGIPTHMDSAATGASAPTTLPPTLPITGHRNDGTRTAGTAWFLLAISCVVLIAGEAMIVARWRPRGGSIQRHP